MQLFKRLLSAALTPAEDPRRMAAPPGEPGSDAMERAEALLDQVRRALATTRAAAAQLEVRRAAVRGTPAAAIDQQLQQVHAADARLSHLERRVCAQVDALRARREAVVVRYAAATAQAQATEVLDDLCRDLDEAGFSVAQAEEAAERLEARVQAIEELTARGVL